MARENWCEHCNDWFSVNHYGPDGVHLAGNQYGFVGQGLAAVELLKKISQDIKEVTVDPALVDQLDAATGNVKAASDTLGQVANPPPPPPAGP